MGKYFGTDGFRGEANKNLTFEHAIQIGRYLGWYYGVNQGKKANLTYYRTSKGEIEVDMIADWRHTFAVEIKSSTDPETGKASKVRKYVAERGTEDILPAFMQES